MERKEGDVILGLVGFFISKFCLFLGHSELYGETTVFFSLCLSGSTPGSSPYTLYRVCCLKFCNSFVGEIQDLLSLNTD